jgi:transposase
MKYFVGIDIGKYAHYAAACDAERKSIGKPFKVTVNPKGFEKLRKFLEATGEPSDFLIGMEATGHYWRTIQEYLDRFGYRCAVINPFRSNRFREFTMTRTKTDAVDAEHIAQLVAREEGTAYHLPENMLAIRELSRCRVGLKKMNGSLKNKITRILDIVFPEFRDAFSKKNMFCKSGLALLALGPFPQQIRRMAVEELSGVTCGARKHTVGMKRATLILESARNSIGSAGAPESYGDELKTLVNLLHQAQASLKGTERSIRREFAKTHLDHLCSMPCMSKETVALLVGEIVDAKRFASVKELYSFLGLCPKISESGTSRNPHPHISRMGSKYARWGLYMNTLSCVGKNGTKEDKAFFKNFTRRKGSEKAALVALSQKRLRLFYALWKSGRSYDPDFAKKRAAVTAA